jgi:ADP-ribose pyrophosphatase YjhB (NUDIX family)
MKQPRRVILSGGLLVNNKKEILLLFRKDHKHFETPGGKLETSDCKNSNKITTEDLARAALREIHEELGKKIKLGKLKFFTKVEFKLPDGRFATANKFLTKIISGEPEINEPMQFSRIKFININELENYPVSPDLKLLIPQLKKYFA